MSAACGGDAVLCHSTLDTRYLYRLAQEKDNL